MYGEPNIEEEYQPDNILKEQQRFDERNADFTIWRGPQTSTPIKRAQYEDDRASDGENPENRPVSEDNRASDGEIARNETIGVSGVSLLDPTNVDAPDNQIEQELQLNTEENTNHDVQARPQPELRLDKGAKSSRKRKRNQVNKHPILEPCTCKQNCTTKFCESVRKEIHSKYWEMPYDKQQTWLSGQTTSRNPNRIRVRGEKRQTKPNRTSTYFLPNMGEDIQVLACLFITYFLRI